MKIVLRWDYEEICCDEMQHDLMNCNVEFDDMTGDIYDVESGENIVRCWHCGELIEKEDLV